MVVQPPLETGGEPGSVVHDVYARVSPFLRDAAAVLETARSFFVCVRGVLPPKAFGPPVEPHP